MYTDFRRLKTAKIEGGAYIAPPQAESSTLFGRLYRVKASKIKSYLLGRNKKYADLLAECEYRDKLKRVSEAGIES